MKKINKRVIAPFFILVLLSVGLIFRIADISYKEYSDAVYEPSAKVINVAESRGMIYDRNMLPLVCSEGKTVLAVNPTQEAAQCLKNSLSDEEYRNIVKSIEAGKPFLAQCGSYSGQCDDISVLTVYDRYNDEDSAPHIIGYLNGDGNGISGVEKSFDSYLAENSGDLSIRFTADVSGRALSGKGIEIIDNNYMSPAGVALTVDKRIQGICENAASQGGIEKGAVVVLKVDTSEILALVSCPSFDRSDMGKSLSDDSSPFYNRALNAYSVGSVFKPVVACAALENGISESSVLECAGSVNVGSRTFSCHNRSGHGPLNMGEAMAVSCNSYYINTGLKAGRESILRLASQFGFGSEIKLADGIVSSSGNLPDIDEIDSPQALANLSFGQGTLLATPLQIAALYCAFANGGYYSEPYIMYKIIDKNGEETAYYKNEKYYKVISDTTCNKICSMLTQTVETGSGKLAKPSGGTAAGKTATAQTGWYENGEEVVHTWFAGYFPSDDPQYAVVVFKENGNSSSTDCAPVFRSIAEEIAALGDL